MGADLRQPRFRDPPDIINVLCVWRSNDPTLIQLHVVRAVETLPSNMVKELRSLLQSSSGCFCF